MSNLDLLFFSTSRYTQGMGLVLTLKKIGIIFRPIPVVLGSNPSHLPKNILLIGFFLSLIVFSMLNSCATWNSGPNLAKEYYNLGQAYFDLKKYADSARAYKIAMSLDPTLHVAQINLVRALAEQNDLDGAWNFLQPLLQKDPDNFVLLKVRAYLLWLRGKKEESSQLWKELAAKLPADAETQFNFAYVANKEGWKDEEWQALNRYADLGGQEPRAWNMLGLQALEREKWNKALQAYTQVTKIDPKDAQAFADLSKVYVNLERFDDAAKALKTAIKVEDANAQTAAAPATTGASSSNPVPGAPPNTVTTQQPQGTTSQTPSEHPSGTSGTPVASPPPAGTSSEVPGTPTTTTPAGAAGAASSAPVGAHKAEWSYRLGTILLYGLEDYPGAIEAFRTAWNAGWKDQKIWKKLLAVPDLPQKTRLEGDLTTLGVFGAKP
jgi:tetratricopeptide (TPR) repeat protein